MGRLGHTLSTLRPVGRPTGRKTRFRLLARLCRVGSRSHWAPPKGFFDASYIAFPLSQAYPGASARRSRGPEQETPQCEVTAACRTSVRKGSWLTSGGREDRRAQPADESLRFWPEYF